MDTLNLQAQALEAELAWLQAMVSAALKLHFQQACEVTDVRDIPPQALPAEAPYARALAAWSLGADERVVLILALAPHVRPQVLDPFLMRNANLDQPFSQFGGHAAAGHRGFWPTAETAAFILAGDRMDRRLAVQRLFEPDGALRRLGLLAWEDDATAQRAALGQPLQLGAACRGALTTGAAHPPADGSSFPAQRMRTTLDWQDLVLPAEVQAGVEEIRAWITHHPTLSNHVALQRRLQPGYRSLFYGPPGTGKTLTAALLGKSTGRDVYRVDLSLAVSRYIGETEKNLLRVFDEAERSNAILFFDEADALFGKRSEVSDAHDRFANQQVAWLLQRIEAFPGVTLMASSLKGNLDDAFVRRFQSTLYFPMPGPHERCRLWRAALDSSLVLEAGVDVDQLAHAFELSGGAIVDVLRHAALHAAMRGESALRLDDIRQGVARALRKEGRVSRSD